jgi:hypothetical protein
MKYIQIYNKWTDFINIYKIYFLTNQEIWYFNLEQIKEYIKNNNKKPLHSDINVDIKKLGSWIHTQKLYYKNKTRTMKNIKIYNSWTEFINNNKYKQYL